MTLSDFWLSVLASVIASILVAVAAKITLEKWKHWAIGIGTTAFVAGTGTETAFKAKPDNCVCKPVT